MIADRPTTVARLSPLDWEGTTLCQFFFLSLTNPWLHSSGPVTGAEAKVRSHEQDSPSKSRSALLNLLPYALYSIWDSLNNPLTPLVLVDGRCTVHRAGLEGRQGRHPNRSPRLVLSVLCISRFLAAAITAPSLTLTFQALEPFRLNLNNRTSNNN